MLLWFLRHCWQLNYRFPYSSYFQKQESFIGNHKVLKIYTSPYHNNRSRRFIFHTHWFIFQCVQLCERKSHFTFLNKCPKTVILVLNFLSVYLDQLWAFWKISINCGCLSVVLNPICPATNKATVKVLVLTSQCHSVCPRVLMFWRLAFALW